MGRGLTSGEVWCPFTLTSSCPGNILLFHVAEQSLGIGYRPLERCKTEQLLVPSPTEEEEGDEEKEEDKEDDEEGANIQTIYTCTTLEHYF